MLSHRGASLEFHNFKAGLGGGTITPQLPLISRVSFDQVNTLSNPLVESAQFNARNASILNQLFAERAFDRETT
jgi:hypothetical protein